MTGGGPTATSDGSLGWGIVATGGIAELMTRDLLAHGHRVVAVGSRRPDAAEGFAARHGIERSHGSYDELLADPGVDVVYVATPHPLHAENALSALAAGKHVLVEKPFTLNAPQARAVVREAAERNLVVMEAMWTRFLPHMRFVREVAASGRLGDVRSLHADHTQRLTDDPTHRLNDPALGGGALLDLGAYPVAFAHDVLGPVVDVAATATMRATGVDEAVSTTLRHRDGGLSTSFSSSTTRGPNVATVLGTEGRIDLEAVWYSPTTVVVRDDRGRELDRFDGRVSGRGMQYQAAELERVVTAGGTSSPLLPPEESVAVMETLDRVRAAIGLRYPDE
ncbi:MAG TPA: Gfo/Idh/MocA family oxidoreductase [Nocardioides sp.]|nr:Gfo/Idh/MocA family oxidoreductase [Nocardioides sp.]